MQWTFGKCLAAALLVVGLCAGGAAANPDVIVGDVYDPVYYGQENGIHAYALGTISCNQGTSNLLWQSQTPLHPVIGQNLYRLKDGRFEQIGMSWLKHGFTALTQNLCATCSGQGGSVLGVGCSDPYSGSLNGGQTRLGPRSRVNATTGVFPYNGSAEPSSWPAYSGVIARRLQVRNADIQPALNPGAQYFIEGQYVTQDDHQSGNSWNNASYRKVTVGSSLALTLAAPTQRTKPAIQAWKDVDPQVMIESVDVPGDGRYWVASRVYDNNDGTYTYQYAVQNLTSDRSGGSFTLPIPGPTTVTDFAFNAPFYHSGEPYSNDPWTMQREGNTIAFRSPQTYSQNANSNALRWGTMYSYRFTINAAPVTGTAKIGLFKPGASGAPDEVEVPAIVAALAGPRPPRVTVDSAAIPLLVPAATPLMVNATVDPRDDVLQPGGVRLFYKFSDNPNASFESAEMTPTAAQFGYQAMIPAAQCGEKIAFFVAANGESGEQVTDPPNGWTQPKTVAIGTVAVQLEDDFQANTGWAGSAPGDNATSSGRWVRDDPLGTNINNSGVITQIAPNDDHTPGAGTFCWMTGQSLPAAPATNSDVDGGTTTLVSPVIDLAGAQVATLSYWRWFFNGVSGTGQDVFRVQVSSDNGASWVTVETVGPTGPDVAGGWFFKEVQLAPLIPLTSQVRVRFVAQDLGTDQIVEAAVDDFKVTRTFCNTPRCPADFDVNNLIDSLDLFAFADVWFDERGQVTGTGDFDRSGMVDEDDIFAFVADWIVSIGPCR